MTSQHIPLLHAAEDYCVINKPAGLMLHDSALARGETDFLADRLRTQLGREIYLVHRLDRATSGCLLVAHTREVASVLGRAWMAGEVEKTYLAVCRGWPVQASFTIDHPLDGGPGKPLKKQAITHFEVLGQCELPMPGSGFPTSRYALLRASPQTGRFRQIRRHLKHAFHHLMGDSSHGDGRHNRNFRMLGVHRMLLHAHTLTFACPETGNTLRITAPWDAQFTRALALFENAARID